MSDPMSEIVPFGKYKGQPAALLAADTKYCDWLVSQDWFHSKYGNIYNIVISGGGEPQDSPEHNEMQARFLDDSWCLQLAVVLYPDLAGGYGEYAARRQMEDSATYREFRAHTTVEVKPACVEQRTFEDHGWDVSFTVRPARVLVRVPTLKSLPPCRCRCDHAADCPEDSSCRGGDGGDWRCRHRGHPDKRGTQRDDHCTESCPWHKSGEMQAPVPKADHGTWAYGGAYYTNPDATKAAWLRYGHGEGHAYSITTDQDVICVELKPDLGDDYPAVLRQVISQRRARARGTYGSFRWCVVVRRHTFQHVTWEQVQQIYSASAVTLLAESDLAAEPLSVAERTLRDAGMLGEGDES